LASNNLNKASFFSDMKKFMPLLKNLVTKDFKLKYRRSVLGVAWSVLNPLFTMLVITTVFGRLLKIQIENFASYYIVGYAIWNFFSEATSNSLSSILSASSLIKKVYIPKYLFPIEKCLFSLVNFLFTLVAVVVVMLFQGVTPGINALLFPLPVACCFVFVCGISLFLSAATVFFRDIQHLYSVLLTVLMYLTPIIYPLELIEGETLVSTIVHLNPMTHYVEYFRHLVMYNMIPMWQENIWCVGAALVSLLIGALVFRKAQRKFILHI
jgi:ABC-2 type transport system permease protein